MRSNVSVLDPLTAASMDEHEVIIMILKSNNSSAPSNKDVEIVRSLDSTDTTSKLGNKPPVLLPKPNPDLLVKRFKFKKLQKPENDNISSTSSTSLSPAVDQSSFATTTRFEKPKAPSESLLPDATPTPPSSLHLPRDRRPSSARGSINSDSIEI